MNNEDRQTALCRYQVLSTKRDPYLRRARDVSALTLPTVFPPEGDNSGRSIKDPYQSIGSRGCNNLASKLLLALLPPNTSFFRYKATPKAELSMEKFPPEMKKEIDEALSAYEREVLNEIERAQLRSAVVMALKHLIIGGNVLLYVPNEGRVRYFPLHSYVVHRDPSGNILEIYVKEQVAPSTLPKDVLEHVKDTMGDSYRENESVDLYTGIVLSEDGQQWDVWQEVCGKEIPGSTGTYPKDDCQWFALRFSRLDGEDYGRGYAEEYKGDLDVAEALSKAIAQGSLASAKVIFLVSPNSPTSAKTLQNTPNCGFAIGRKEDVSCLQVEKHGDFQVGLQTLQEITSRLGYAFLLNGAVQRNAERVTAEEIRFVAQELESALGGVYSLLAEEFQRPLILRLTNRLTHQGVLGKLPANMVRPAIITGLEALGRGAELTAFERAMSGITQFLGPQAALEVIKPEQIVSMYLTANGLDPTKLVRSQQEIEQRRQQAQQAAMAQQLTPEIIKQGGGILKAQMQQNGQPQSQEVVNK